MANLVEKGEPLSGRELEILKLIYFEKEDIASKLCLSKATVNTYLENIRKKLGVNNRHNAVLIALKQGLLKVEDFITE